jgi:hypothetical protein
MPSVLTSAGGRILLAGSTSDALRTGSGGGPPSVTFADTFQRADAADLGANWTNDVGTWGIVSNAAQSNGTPLDIATYNGISANDMAVSAKVEGLASSFSGLVGRLNPSTNACYWVEARWAVGNNWSFTLRKFDGTSASGLMAGVASAPQICVLELVLQGPKISFYCNGMLSFVWFDSTYPGPGRAGIVAKTNAMRIDSFAVSAPPA